MNLFENIHKNASDIYLPVKTMKYIKSKNFRKDLRRAVKRCKDLQKLHQVLNYIQQGISLPYQYRNHPLWQGDYHNAWECHIEPDWLLIYRHDADNFLWLIRTGTHSDCF